MAGPEGHLGGGDTALRVAFRLREDREKKLNARVCNDEPLVSQVACGLQKASRASGTYSSPL
jgi:hypothetical protein